MAILRKNNRDKFTVVGNDAIRDENLSLKALGLLVHLLSLPDDWEFSEDGLVKIFKKDGQSSIRSGLKELECAGYLIRERRRDDKGHLATVEWTVFENPHLGNRNLDNPNLDNRPQYNTNTIKDVINKESNNTPYNPPEGEQKKQKRFSKPTVAEVAEYCMERSNGIDAQYFVDYYEANGWRVGKNPMKNWKAAVRTWEKNNSSGRGYQNKGMKPKSDSKPKKESSVWGDIM